MAAFSRGRISDVFGKAAIVNKWPLLLKATSDDEKPIPGYIYPEISALTYGGPSQQQGMAVLSFLLDRLDKKSWHIKVKTLQVMKYVVEHGEAGFRNSLRRQTRAIQEATKYNAAPDPLHGNAPILAVRQAASELLEVLFNDSLSVNAELKTAQHSENKMQGFGSTHNHTPQKSVADTIKDNLQQLSSAITLPSSQDTGYRSLHCEPKNGPLGIHTSGEQFQNSLGSYEPVTLEYRDETTAARIETDQSGVSSDFPADDLRHLEAYSDHGHLTVSSSSHSAGSYDLNQKLETVAVADWSQEVQLANELITAAAKKMTTVPSREEINSFIKRGSTLNCEKIIEILVTKMRMTEDNQVGCLCGVEAIMREGLVTAECVLPIIQDILPSLQQSNNTTVQAKATKIQRQLDQSDQRFPVASNPHLDNQNAASYSLHGSKEESRTNLFSGMSVKKESSNTNAINIRHSLEMENRHSKELINSDSNTDLLTLDGDNRLDLDVALWTLDLDHSNRTEEIVEEGDNSILKESAIGSLDGFTDSKMDTEMISLDVERTNKTPMDPLISRDAHLSDFLESLGSGQEMDSEQDETCERFEVKPLKTQERTNAQQHAAEVNLGDLYPQLVGAKLSSESAVPLQLGKAGDTSFDFISVRSEECRSDSFDFVQEAMKGCR